MDNRPIGFFDSGVGGLTCIPTFQERLPNERIVYYGDTARAPYGSKTLDNIKTFSFQIADYLVSHNVKMIVIACNTISATCLGALRRRHPDIPIIGIIDPIAEKIANEVKTETSIGVIGTKVTITSGAYVNQITSKNKNVKLFSIACPAFAPLIEEGIIDNKIMDLTIRYYLDDFIAANKISKLVLGCTHYPFLTDNLNRLYPDLELLNPSQEVVYKVERLLDEYDLHSAETGKVSHKCYASDLSQNFYDMVNLAFKDQKDVIVDFKRFEDEEL